MSEYDEDGALTNPAYEDMDPLAQAAFDASLEDTRVGNLTVETVKLEKESWMFTVQMSEEEYRIVGPDGEEGCAVEYGEVATLAIEDAIYYCRLEDSDEQPTVYQVASVKPMATNPEEVEFGEAEEDEDEAEDEEDDESDEPVTVETESSGPKGPEVVR